jgi:hypothetical protein
MTSLLTFRSSKIKTFVSRNRNFSCFFPIFFGTVTHQSREAITRTSGEWRSSAAPCLYANYAGRNYSAVSLLCVYYQFRSSISLHTESLLIEIVLRRQATVCVLTQHFLAVLRRAVSVCGVRDTRMRKDPDDHWMSFGLTGKFCASCMCTVVAY